MRDVFTTVVDGKRFMLLSRCIRDNFKVYIFREDAIHGWKTESELPTDKEIIINERTGIPFLKSIKNGTKT